MRRAVVLFAAAAGALAPPATAAPLVAHAAYGAATVQLGELVHTQTVVVVDPSVVRAGSVRVVASLAPLTPVGDATTTRTTQDGRVLIVTQQEAQCVAAACVAARLRPAAVRVTAESRGGAPLHAVARWPLLHVHARVTSADLARAQPPFRTDTVPPPPTYAISPGTLAWLLDAAAIVLALAAAALVAATLVARRRSHAPSRDAGELERAIRLAREAAARPPSDRRRALALLARVLDRRDRRLADEASDLAWSPPPPGPDVVETLAADAEQGVTR